MAIIVFLLVAPVLEVLVGVEVVGQVGWLPVLGWVALSVVVGWLIMKTVGLSAWATVRRNLAQGRLPGEALAGALLTMLAGALIFLPGLISDAIGLALLVPPVRAEVRRRTRRRWGQRIRTVHVVDVHEIPDAGDWPGPTDSPDSDDPPALDR